MEILSEGGQFQEQNTYVPVGALADVHIMVLTGKHLLIHESGLSVTRCGFINLAWCSGSLSIPTAKLMLPTRLQPLTLQLNSRKSG